MDATESVQPSNSKKPPKRRSRSSGVGILRSAKPLEDIENVLKEEKGTRNRRVSFCNTVEVKEFGLAEESEAGTSRKHPPSDPVDSDIQISTPACKRQRRISDLKVKMGRLSIIPKLDKSICGDDVCEDFDILADDVDDPKKENAGEVPPVPESQQGAETSQHADMLKGQPYDAHPKVSSPTVTHALPSELGGADMSLTSSFTAHEPCASTFVKTNKHAVESVNMNITRMASPTVEVGGRCHGACVGENAYSVGQHYRTQLEPVDMSLTLSPVGCGDGTDGASYLATALATKAGADMSLTCVAPHETRADMSLDPDESDAGMSFTCVAPNADMSLTCVASNGTHIEPLASGNRPLHDGLRVSVLPETPHSTTCLNPIDMSLISSAEPVRRIASLRQLQNGPQGMPPNRGHILSAEESFVGAVADEMDTRGSADMDFTCMDETMHSRSMHEVPLAGSTAAVLQRPESTIAAALTITGSVMHDRSTGPAQGNSNQGADGKVPANGAGASATGCPSGPTPSCHGSNSSSTKEDTDSNLKRLLPAIGATVIPNGCSGGRPLLAQPNSRFSFSGNADVAHTTFKVAADRNGVEVRSGEKVLLVAGSQATLEADNGDGQASILEEEPWTEIVAEEIIDDDQYIISASHVLGPEENTNTVASHVLNGGKCHSPVSHKAQQCIPVDSEPEGIARNTFTHEPSLALVQGHPSTNGCPVPSTLNQPQAVQQQDISGTYWGKKPVTQQDVPSEPDGKGPCASTLYLPPAADQSCAPSLPLLPFKGTEDPTPQMQHRALPPPAEHPHGVASLPPKPRDQPLVLSAHSAAQPVVLSAQRHTSLDQPLQNDSGSWQHPPSSASLLHGFLSSQSAPNNPPSTHDWLHPASSIALQMKMTSRETERPPLLQIPNEQPFMTQTPNNQPTLSKLPQRQTMHHSLFQKQMGQPPLSQKRTELQPVSVMQVDQLPVFQEQMEQPSVSMRQMEQPLASTKHMEQSSASLNQIEQSSASEKQMEQPLASLKHMERSSASVKHMEQSSTSMKQMEQPPVSWDHLQSALREHLSSAKDNPMLPLNCTFSKTRLEHQDQRESIAPFNNNIALPSSTTPQTKPCNPTLSSTVTKVPGTGLLTELGSTDTSNWLQSSALDYSIPLMEDSCDSPTFAVRQRAAMQCECSSKLASREVSLCVAEGEMGEDHSPAEGFDLSVFQEDLTDLRHKLLAVLRELSSRWKVERSGLMQDAILHLFLSASIYLGGISFLREYGISSGMLSSECSSTAVTAPLCTEYLRRVQWLQKVYMEVKQLHERTVSVIKRAPRIYPWVLVVWSENLVEVKVPASEAMLEIQLETKVDVMQGAFSQSITEVHWGSTAALKPSTIPKPPNADDILKVVEKITKRDLLSDQDEVMCA